MMTVVVQGSGVVHGMLGHGSVWRLCTAGLFLCTYVLSLLKSCEATSLQPEPTSATAGSNFHA